MTSEEGILMVASAGNRGAFSFPCAEYPASFAEVISVSGLDWTDVKPNGSDSPTFSDSVDLSAPMFNWAAHPSLNDSQYFDYCFGKDSLQPACPGDPTTPFCGVGTSYAAPLVAGVAALLKSVYPGYRRELEYDIPATVNRRILAKLRSSTDSIYHLPGNTGFVGKLGTGRLNAFKALTFFGNIPNAANDTTLSGTVYVSGDIKVKAGKTLRLEEGTVLKFYPGDVMKAGVDIGKEEIIVEAGGKLIIEGTPANPVKLISFRSEAQASTDDWRVIVVRPGGYVSIENAIIRHAYAAIEDSSAFSHTIKNVKIGRCKMFGIKAVNTDSLTIRGCRVDSVKPASGPGGYGIYNITENLKGARLVTDTVRHSWYGIFISGGTAPVESCLVQGDSTGTIVSYIGIFNQGQGSLGDTLPISHTNINGYFSLAHLENWGLVKVTSCTLFSSLSPRSPSGIRNTSEGLLKLRKSAVIQWGSTGVLVGNSGESNLGRVSPADSGFNTIYTFASGSSWKYVKDGDCPSSCGVTVKAEWNCWGVPIPSSTRFSSNVDYQPVWTFCMDNPDFKIAGGEGEILPRRTELFQNYPNPFNPTTQIQFTLEKTEPVRLEIFNILGQKVKTMLSGEEFSAGPYTFNWNGRDDGNVPVSSGTYVYKLATPSFRATKKMILVK